jgi:short subunit fatty acids transporter
MKFIHHYTAVHIFCARIVVDAFFMVIVGILMGAGLTEVLSNFLSISTQETMPVIVGSYSAVLGLFLPSGGKTSSCKSWLGRAGL